jgi:glycine/D-amino acid oxidase-like deaminating enzyme
MSGRSVVVIGGGVIGVSSAYYLARDGWEVTLLEKGDICAGSSYGNAGLVVPSHSVPLAAPGVLWQGENLILATGHAMIGVSLGPVTGKLVAQLAAGAPPLCDLRPVSPDRFGT